MTVNGQEFKQVKGIGVLHNHGTEDEFFGSIITENDVITTKQQKNVSEAAAKFGIGKVTFTSRLTIKIPGIKFEDIEAFREYIAQDGLITGGTGAEFAQSSAEKGQPVFIVCMILMR